MKKDPPADGFSILFIVPTDYASLLEKGVASMILEREEEGFFKRVFNTHPYASKTQTVDLNETNRLIEFGPDYPLSLLNFRGGSIINYWLKPIPIIKALTQLVKREHIHLIRATDPYWCGFYAWTVSKLTGVPFCISIHTDYDQYYKKIGKERGVPFLFKIFEMLVLPRAHLVMPIREHLVSHLLKRRVDRAKIRVIPHGINVDEFSCTENKKNLESFGITSGKKIISYVGRLAEDNYVYEVIELVKRLSKIRDDFIVLLVGDGPEGEKLRKLVQENNLSPQVLFSGFLSKEQVIAIRRQSFFSLCLKGGFSLIEACLAGCPIVSYDVEWHYELVKNGETGFLVQENDLEGLVKAAIYLLDHPTEAEEMGEKARRLATARHNIAFTSEIKKNCYRELLGMEES